MTALPFQFPVLALIRAPAGGWYDDVHDEIEYFLGETDFATLTPYDLQGDYADMRLVDVTGRCWRITGTTKLGVKGTSWRKVLNAIFSNFTYRYELTEEAPMTFEAVRDHICAAIKADPVGWRDDEAIAGESGPPREEQEMLEEKIERCRRTTNMHELVDTFIHLTD